MESFTANLNRTMLLMDPGAVNPTQIKTDIANLRQQLSEKLQALRSVESGASACLTDEQVRRLQAKYPWLHVNNLTPEDEGRLVLPVSNMPFNLMFGHYQADPQVPNAGRFLVTTPIYNYHVRLRRGGVSFMNLNCLPRTWAAARERNGVFRGQRDDFAFTLHRAAQLIEPSKGLYPEDPYRALPGDSLPRVVLDYYQPPDYVPSHPHSSQSDRDFDSICYGSNPFYRALNELQYKTAIDLLVVLRNLAMWISSGNVSDWHGRLASESLHYGLPEATRSFLPETVRDMEALFVKVTKELRRAFPGSDEDDTGRKKPVADISYYEMAEELDVDGVWHAFMALLQDHEQDFDFVVDLSKSDDELPSTLRYAKTDIYGPSKVVVLEKALLPMLKATMSEAYRPAQWFVLLHEALYRLLWLNRSHSMNFHSAIGRSTEGSVVLQFIREDVRSLAQRIADRQFWWTEDVGLRDLLDAPRALFGGMKKRHPADTGLHQRYAWLDA